MYHFFPWLIVNNKKCSTINIYYNICIKKSMFCLLLHIVVASYVNVAQAC